MSLGDYLPFGSDDQVNDVEEAERRHGEEYDTSVYNQRGEYSIREDEIRDLDKINLENFRDTEGRSLRTQIKENRRIFWLAVLVAIPFTLWLINIALPWLGGFSLTGLAPTIGVIVVAGIYLAGRKSMINTMSNYNIVVGYLQKGAALLITKDTDVEGQEVVRGFTSFGWRANTLKVGDLSKKLERYNQRQNYEDTVRIRLKPEHTRVISNTLLGDIYITHGKELRIDPEANAVMSVTRPDFVDRDEYKSVVEKFKNTLDLLDAKDEELKTEREQRYDAERRASRRRSRIIEDFIENHTELRKAEIDTTVYTSPAQSQYGELEKGDNNE